MILKKCGIIVISKDDFEILLVRGKKSKKWGFPKGHMEFGETEEETAKRELYEETGIHIDDLKLRNRLRFKNNIYFFANVDKSKIKINIQDKDEIEKAMWFNKRQLLELPLYTCNFGLKNYIEKQKYFLSV